MRQVSAELAAAIEAPERTTRLRLAADWDGDGFGGPGSIDDLSDKISGATLSRTLQSDVPAEVRVVEGSVVAKFNADLAAGDTADDRLRSIRYWSRFNTASPMYGRPRMGVPVTATVELLTANGWQGVPRFQGLTRALPVDVGQRIAKLGVLDQRQLLRGALSLPVIIADAPQTTPFSRQSPGLESTWVASFVAAQNGYYVSPPPRPGCRLWTPMHGSTFPFIGDLVTGVSVAQVADVATTLPIAPVTFDTGPFLLGTAVLPDFTRLKTTATTTHDQATARIVGADGHSRGRIEMRAKEAPAGGTLTFRLDNLAYGGHAYVDLTVTSGDVLQLNIDMTGNGFTLTTVNGPTLVRASTWRSIGVWWDTATGQVRFWLDGAATSATFTPPTPAAWNPAVEAYDTTVDLIGWQVAEVQLTGGTAAADLWVDQIPFTPRAVIDRGYPLQGIVDTSPQDSWQILTDLASGGLGATWFDEDSILQAAMPGRLVGESAQVVQRVLTSLTDIIDLAYDDRADTVRNRIICPYSPIVFHSGETLWTSPEKVWLGPGKTAVIYATLGNPFVATPAVSAQANTKADGTGTVGNVGVTAVYPSAREAVITVRNYGVGVYLVDTSGQSALKVTGNWLEQSAGAVPPDYSDVAPGQPEQPLTLPSNRWVQDRSVAAGLAMAVLCNLRRERQTLTNLAIPADPRLQFFDRIQVQDKTSTGLDTPFWVAGVAEDYGPGYIAKLTARQAQNRFLAGVGLAGEDLVG